MKRLFAAAAAVLALATAAPAAQAEPTARNFSATYTIIAKGLSAGEFKYDLSLANGGYEAKASRKMTGFVRALAGSSQDYRYASSGKVTSSGLTPTAYEHQGGKKNRLVKVNFAGGAPETTATPSMGMGDPPATVAQKAGSVDQLTAIGRLVLSSNPCSGVEKVLLDGRARFDFVMGASSVQKVNTRAYKGDAIKCEVGYKPIAGFSDPQDPATLTFLFAKLPSGVYAPIRIEMPTDDVGVAVLQATSVSAS